MLLEIYRSRGRGSSCRSGDVDPARGRGRAPGSGPAAPRPDTGTRALAVAPKTPRPGRDGAVLGVWELSLELV